MVPAPFVAPRQEVQQQFVDRSGLLDLRAVAGLWRPPPNGRRDLPGDLGRPSRRQQLVAPALHHQRRHGDAVVGPRARRRRRRLQPGPAKPGRRQRLPCAGRDAGLVAPLHIRRRRRDTTGRRTAPRRSGACRRRWRRSRRARRRARCAGSRRRRRSSPGCASGSTGDSDVASTNRLIAPIELPTKCADFDARPHRRTARCA